MQRRVRGRFDRFTVWLALIACAGFIGRVTYVIWMRNRAVAGDGPYYHHAANYLVDGHVFVNPLVRLIAGIDVPDAGHPPLWTLVLAIPSALGLHSWLT